MALRLGWVTLDAPEPARLAAFWEALLGWERTHVRDHMVELTAPSGDVRMLLFHAPDEKVVKNRMHLDLVADDLDDEVERAIGLGAERVDIGQDEASHWVVLADPEGNEFCIVSRPVLAD